MNNTFIIKVNGIEYKYQIIKLLTKNKFKNKYVIYTDGKETFASKYEIVNNDVILSDIESDEEWEYIDNNYNNEGENKNEL